MSVLSEVLLTCSNKKFRNMIADFKYALHIITKLTRNILLWKYFGSNVFYRSLISVVIVKIVITV